MLVSVQWRVGNRSLGGNRLGFYFMLVFAGMLLQLKNHSGKVEFIHINSN